MLALDPKSLQRRPRDPAEHRAVRPPRQSGGGRHGGEIRVRTRYGRRTRAAMARAHGHRFRPQARPQTVLRRSHGLERARPRRAEDNGHRVRFRPGQRRAVRRKRRLRQRLDGRRRPAGDGHRGPGRLSAHRLRRTAPGDRGNRQHRGPRAPLPPHRDGVGPRSLRGPLHLAKRLRVPAARRRARCGPPIRKDLAGRSAHASPPSHSARRSGGRLLAGVARRQPPHPDARPSRQAAAIAATSRNPLEAIRADTNRTASRRPAIPRPLAARAPGPGLFRRKEPLEPRPIPLHHRDRDCRRSAK